MIVSGAMRIDPLSVKIGPLRLRSSSEAVEHPVRGPTVTTQEFASTTSTDATQMEAGGGGSV